MIRKSLTVLFFILNLILFSCKKNEIKSTHKNTSAQSVKDISKSFNHELFNNKIIALSATSENKDLYKNFEIDFYANCMCEPSSFYIDNKKNKIFLLDICSEGIEDVKYIFDIEEISKKKNTLKVKIKNRDLSLNFKKEGAIFLYSFFVEGNLPDDYAGFRVYKYYTDKKTSQKFHSEDCGDFDG